MFDETVAVAIKQKLVSHHTTLDGTLVQSNASHKSFVPMVVFLNPTITFRGERRSNQTHVSTTDPDAKLANKGNGTAAMVGYTVNGLMENRHRLLLGIKVESFWGPASETEGWRDLIDTFHEKHALRIQTVGAGKGYFASPF